MNGTKPKFIDENVSTCMLLQDIAVDGIVARTQWDDGSNKVLITHNFAKKAKLSSFPAEYYLQVAGEGWKKKNGVMYTFNLISNKGVIYKLWGYGIERISDSIPAVDFNEARNLFPHVPNAAFDVLEEKPVDI